MNLLLYHQMHTLKMTLPLLQAQQKKGAKSNTISKAAITLIWLSYNEISNDIDINYIFLLDENVAASVRGFR